MTTSNPLFPEAPAGGTALPPAPASKPAAVKNNPAVNVIRQKIASLYAREPDPAKESQEAEMAQPRSKHQEFIYQLNASGKSVAEVQTAWHEYYVKLPDHEKHQVWQEFYAANARTSQYQKYTADHPVVTQAEHLLDGAVVSDHTRLVPSLPFDKRAPAIIKRQVINHINSRVKASARSQFRSLAFGLGMGAIVIIIFLFSFFNEIIIAPFIQPSRHVNATPIIVGASTSVAKTPEVIIPKINVEIPVDYNLTTDNEAVVEDALEDGVVHYPSTVLPGQNGNAAFFGHSSNNIFNPGKYKFAFVLLHTMVKGDTFYLTYNGQLYVYQVIKTQVVPPSDVSVLNDTDGQTATATLITCDPPGTSINRLVVTGEQISPNPDTNTAASTYSQAVAQPDQLASNGPSLWDRFWDWLF